jgi:hypothetical protein
MKSLIKKCSIRALGYDRFLIGTYCMRRLQQSIFREWSEFVAVGLIKLDVEGSECDVLRGMRTSVGSSRPYIHAEVCGDVAIGEFNGFCADNGYGAYRWRSRQFHRASEIVGGGNFLLVPREREDRLRGNRGRGQTAKDAPGRNFI